MRSLSSSPVHFSYEKLECYAVAREALIHGEAVAKALPKGYGHLGDQCRRALLSCVLGIAEASARSGADRLGRFRCARGECSEAAAALDLAEALGLVPAAQVQPVVVLLGRVHAMLTRLLRPLH